MNAHLAPGAGAFNLRPVGVGMTPKKSPPCPIQRFQRTVAFFQIVAKTFLTKRAVTLRNMTFAGVLIGNMPEAKRRVILIPFGQAAVYRRNLFPVYRRRRAMIMPLPVEYPYSGVVYPEHFRVLLAHPGRASPRRRTEYGGHVVFGKNIHYLIKPFKAVFAFRRFHRRPG